MSGGTLLLESVAGIAGDMFAAAFVDSGLVPAEALSAVPAALGFDGVGVELERVDRAGVAATALRVTLPGDGGADPAPGGHGHSHTHWRELDRRLAESSLAPAARELARRIYRLLAEAEGAAHGTDPERAALHEVGAVDSLVDVAMAGVCLALTEPERVVATPVRLGHGTISIAHGRYPVPPPASAWLCRGMPLAPTPREIAPERVADLELSTPTGLAILRALEPEFVGGWPPGVPRAAGHGAGGRSLHGYPNVFRVTHFETEGAASGPDALPYAHDRVAEIVCNVDDQTPERTGWLIERSLELGALDAWAAPVVGKKSRPAVRLSLLVAEAELSRWLDWLLRASSSFGVRYRTWERAKLVRTTETRATPAGEVRFQVGSTTKGERIKEKPELEDLRAIWAEDPTFRPPGG